MPYHNELSQEGLDSILGPWRVSVCVCRLSVQTLEDRIQEHPLAFHGG